MEAFSDYEGRVIRLTDDRLQHIVRRPALVGQQTKSEEKVGRIPPSGCIIG